MKPETKVKPIIETKVEKRTELALPAAPTLKAVSTALEFTPEQMKLITDTVAKGATPDELKLFLYRCHKLGLDPLKPGQIYFIKYGNSPGTIVVGIDGFRARANRTGKLAGIKRGAIKDEKGNLVGAWAEVYRSDWQQPAREEIPLAEYNTGKSNWAKMPETMVKKVAEAAALRMAFPDELGGIYTPDEMDQADSPNRIVAQQPPADGSDGNTDPTHYKIDFGKYAQRTLEEVGVDNLRNYVEYLEGAAKKKGQPIDPNGKVGIFIAKAEEFIGAFENSPIEGEETPF